MSKEKRKQDQLSEELKEIVEEKRAAYLKWLSNKEEEDKIIYRKKKKEVKQRIRQKKKEDWEKTCQKVNAHQGYKRSAEAWKVLKSLRKETKHKANLSMKNVEEWYDYYKGLLQENRKDFMEDGICHSCVCGN